jgi:hypothetical protein
MKRDLWFKRRFAWFERAFWCAAVGAALGIVGLAFPTQVLSSALVAVAIILTVPLTVLLVLVPIWHWKERYRGAYSDLWGALLVIEVTGWFKIIYWFRHVIPDWRARGRYSVQSAA